MGIIDAIRDANDRGEPKEYEVPEWGVTLFFRLPDTRSYFEFQQWMADQRKNEDLSAQDIYVAYLVMVCHDENDAPVFQGDDAIEVLRNKSGPVVKRVALAAMEMIQDPVFTDEQRQEIAQEDFTEAPAE